MADEDVRWKQRFTNFRRSVSNLEETLETEERNKLERQEIMNGFADVLSRLAGDLGTRL